MFDRFRKESPALQLYGKLPLAKDYLRVGASKGAGRELRDWMDHAFSSTAVHGSAPVLPWPARFLVGSAEDDPLLGSMWPSSDQGGERAFPFALFVERRRKALLTGIDEGFDGLPLIWARIEDCHAAHREHADGESFLAAMRGREIALPPAAPAAPEPIAWETWTGALWPGEGHEGLVRALASLAQLGATGHRGPLRLPLVGDLPAVPQVVGWRSALAALGLVAESDVPTVFFPQEGERLEEPSFCTFLKGALRVEDARWISSARGQANLGRGDYCSGRPHLAGETEPLPENVPTLVESMRGALASARARG